MDTMLTITWPLFGIIFIGYSARRLKLLNQAEALGVHAFVYYFALPALLCVKVAEMPLSNGSIGRSWAPTMALAVWCLSPR